MPNHRKFYPKDAVLFITSSTEEGLAFIPNLIINTILRSIIARAQYLYGQELCHFLFMSNHFHMILKINNPERVSDFIGYIKGKSAQAINRLLGRGKRTIWCEGFDSPIVLDANAAMEKIVYIYSNPAKARLVDSINQYPGISSWNAFTKGENPKKVRWIRPSTILPIPQVGMTYSQQIKYLNSLKRPNKIFHTLTFTPSSWIATYKSLRKESQVQINKRIISLVKESEQYLSKGEPALGAARLQKQPLNMEYAKKRRGKRMICVGSEIEKRIDFISWFKSMSYRAGEAFRKARYLNIYLPLPPGFFAPGRILHANFFNFMNWLAT